MAMSTVGEVRAGEVELRQWISSQVASSGQSGRPVEDTYAESIMRECEKHSAFSLHNASKSPFMDHVAAMSEQLFATMLADCQVKRGHVFKLTAAKKNLTPCESVPPATAGADGLTPRCPEGVLWFYEKDEPYYQFTNFWPNLGRDPSTGRVRNAVDNFVLSIDGELWPTAEHYYQAAKFSNPLNPLPEIRDKIRRLGTPREAFEFVRGDMEEHVDSSWWHKDAHKEEAMLRAVRAKFTQNPSLSDLLVGTEELILVEHTENDSFWGDGNGVPPFPDGQRWGPGKNNLGQILMVVRNELRLKRSMAPVQFPGAPVPSASLSSLDAAQTTQKLLAAERRISELERELAEAKKSAHSAAKKHATHDEFWSLVDQELPVWHGSEDEECKMSELPGLLNSGTISLQTPILFGDLQDFVPYGHGLAQLLQSKYGPSSSSTSKMASDHEDGMPTAITVPAPEPEVSEPPPELKPPAAHFSFDLVLDEPEPEPEAQSGGLGLELVLGSLADESSSRAEGNSSSVTWASPVAATCRTPTSESDATSHAGSGVSDKETHPRGGTTIVTPRPAETTADGSANSLDSDMPTRRKRLHTGTEGSLLRSAADSQTVTDGGTSVAPLAAIDTAAGGSAIASGESGRTSAGDADSDVGGSEGVRLWLVKCGFGRYADAILDAGYDDLAMFDDANEFDDEFIAEFLSDLMNEEDKATDGASLREAILARQRRA